MPMNSSAISPPPPAYAPPPAQNYGPPGFHDQFEGFGGAMVPGAPPSYEQVEGFTVSGSHASAPAPPSYEQFRKISFVFLFFTHFKQFLHIV